MGKLKLGGKGRAVAKLQKMLNKVGYSVPTDGTFESQTDTAVKDFQTSNGLEADGIVGRQTKVMLKRLCRQMKHEKPQGTKTMSADLALTLSPHIDTDDEFDEELRLEPIEASDAEPFANQHFNSIAEGRQFYQTLQGAGIPANKKASVLAAFRKKVMLDVFGNAPHASETEKIRQTVERESWLNPEGREMYFYYITDNPNFFKGGVKRGSLYYAYTVSKGGGDSYSLKIHVVKNNRSSLAFSSSIKAQKSANAVEVEVFRAENKGYRWDVSKSDYLKAVLQNGNEHIQYSTAGNLGNYKSSGHNVSASEMTAQEEKQFSEKNAIRTALKCFILEYEGVMA